MKTLREAAQMALDALRYVSNIYTDGSDPTLTRPMAALTKALALPDAPVMWQELDNEGVPMCDEGTFCEDATAFDNSRPLYTAPQPAIAPELLTDAEIYGLWESDIDGFFAPSDAFHDAARAIEAAIHAKQTGSKP